MPILPRLNDLGLRSLTSTQAAPSLVVARAAYLHGALPVATWGAGGLGAVLAVLYWMRGLTEEVMPWIAFGAVALLLRLLLGYRYSPETLRDEQDKAPTRFLWGCTLASWISGLMFAWGWWVIYPELTHDERLGLMAANVALLFGGLFAYCVFLPSYIAFCLTSMLPAIRAVYLHGQLVGEWLGATVGASLVMVVSMMFAIRSAIAFRDNHLLQQRELQLLQEITSKRDEAVTATLAKSRFLASVSHDLRQPMHAINLYLTSLSSSYERQQSDPTNESASRTVLASIQSLQESTLYLNGMFESLLDISRLDAGTVAVDLQHVSLVRLVSQLDADYSRLAQAEGIAFDMRLPRQFNVMEIHTDPALLDRLLRNLIVNAFRYTRAGGVRVAVVPKGRAVEFRVVDTGPGIAGELRRRVFEEFYQVPGSQDTVGRSSNTGRGIGLGLSIAARLAEKLGTRIRLHSHVGHGSVFAISLPMRYSLKPVVEEDAAHESLGPLTLPGNTLVAIIDDEPEILRSTRMMLEAYGAQVFTALSAAEAVQRLGQMGQRPDLLISDYRLGTEDGIVAISRLREEFNHDIPAILITGDTSAEHVSIFQDSGLTVLHKPITGEALLAAIREELSSTAAPVR